MTNPKFKNISIEAYRPGKSNGGMIKNTIKLSANESALGVSPKVKKIISNKKINFYRYPDGKSTKLRKEISKRLKRKTFNLWGRMKSCRACQIGIGESSFLTMMIISMRMLS